MDVRVRAADPEAISVTTATPQLPSTGHNNRGSTATVDPHTGRTPHVDGSDVETSDPVRALCTAVRVTPLNDDRTPQHEWGQTYHFEEPVTLLYVHRRRLPEIGSPATGSVTALPALMAFTAPADHPQRLDIAALSQGLWQRRRSGAAVDTWSPLDGEAWAYTLIPHWRHLDRDDWHLPEEPGTRTYAAGCAHPSTIVYRRPAQSPEDGEACTVGTHLFLAVEDTQPPPQGYPALLPETGPPTKWAEAG